MNEASNVESAPAVAVQCVVRPRHPWKQMFINVAKLKEARKEAKRRRERGEKHKELQREYHRIKRGIPADLPVMKPWDYAKGRVV
jgi:hypothetical protein